MASIWSFLLCSVASSSSMLGVAGSVFQDLSLSFMKAGAHVKHMHVMGWKKYCENITSVGPPSKLHVHAWMRQNYACTTFSYRDPTQEEQCMFFSIFSTIMHGFEKSFHVWSCVTVLFWNAMHDRCMHTKQTWMDFMPRAKGFYAWTFSQSLEQHPCTFTW